jgi:PTS system beta-glucosides-specific IIC component
MAKDYNALAKNIIDNIGGEENVISLAHCVIRLRFRLKDEGKVNQEALSKVPGVLKVLHDRLAGALIISIW